jgi:hypothetical protein
MNRSSRRCGTVAFLLIPLALAWFALVPQARAVCQEGCDLSNGNTFLGDDALILNTTGLGNTAVGEFALRNTTSGFSNTALGASTLALNTVGEVNTGSGAGTLFFNTTGSHNTASGGSALFNNTVGNDNTASGSTALFNNKEGNKNVAVGKEALLNNTTGSSNIALGESAGSNLTTGSNNIAIGNKGVAGESNTIRIGKKGTQTTTVIAGINGATVAGGIAVLIGSNGRLGTMTSSARFKDAIKPMDKASEAILALKPVTFRYKHELDPKGIPQFGLVAEDVEKVNPDLVARDDQGKPYSVRYEAVNAMLLNEFLKEHRKVEEQEAIIGELKATTAKQTAMLARQEKAIATLTSQVQQVSARVEAQQAAPRLASE